MERIIVVIIAVMFFLPGCAYHKQTLLKVKGKEVKVPLGPLEGIVGKGLTATLYRNVSVAFPGKEAIKKFQAVKSEETTDEGAVIDTIDVK